MVHPTDYYSLRITTFSKNALLGREVYFCISILRICWGFPFNQILKAFENSAITNTYTNTYTPRWETHLRFCNGDDTRKISLNEKITFFCVVDQTYRIKEITFLGVVDQTFWMKKITFFCVVDQTFWIKKITFFSVVDQTF